MGSSYLKGPSPHDPYSKEEYRSQGKDSSRRHRLLTRPPDIVIGDPRQSSHPGKLDEPLSKRPKGILGHPPPLHPSSSLSSAQGHPSALGVALPPPPPLQPTQQRTQPHYPPHFMKGSVIQLANGELKRVEDLRTEDFVQSAEISGDLKIDSSTVVRIEENMEKRTAILGFSVGEHRVQVR